MAFFALSQWPDPGYDELQKAYLAWRKSWCALGINLDLASTLQDARTIPGAVDALRTLNMWGDILNDYTLYVQGHYTSNDLRVLYGLGPSAIEYFLSARSSWQNEIESLEAFIGL